MSHRANAYLAVMRLSKNAAFDQRLPILNESRSTACCGLPLDQPIARNARSQQIESQRKDNRGLLLDRATLRMRGVPLFDALIVAMNTTAAISAPLPEDARPSTHQATLLRIGLAFLLLHLALWTLLPGWSERSPPWDNIEQLVWSQGLAWGYYKHPPAPTWWVAAFTAVFGRSVWVTYLAAQTNVVLMLLCIWRIAARFVSPVRALCAMVLTAVIGYHSIRGTMANHNTLQLLPVGVLLLAAFRVTEAPSWSRWVVLGLASGWCMLSKYSALLWLAAVCVWLLAHRSQPGMRGRRGAGGVALALLALTAPLVPHVLWLVHDGAASVSYAAHAIAAHADDTRWHTLLRFTGTQLARLLPMGLVLAGVRWTLRGPSEATAGAHFPLELWLLALVPLGLVLALCLAGAHVDSSWASTFFVLFGLLATQALPQVDENRLLRAVLVWALALELIMSLGLAVDRRWLVNEIGKRARSNFPSAALAITLDRIWKHYEPGDVPLVVGETWLAGSAAVQLPNDPWVLIDGDERKSPWVPRGELPRCGALVLADRSPGADAPPSKVSDLLGISTIRGNLTLPWGGTKGQGLRVEWGLLPPQGPSCARLHATS